MAKKQTRRSISVSRTTYERLKAFCETNHISMSQLVETRVNDFLGDFRSDVRISGDATPMAIASGLPPRPSVQRPTPVPTKPVEPRPIASSSPAWSGSQSQPGSSGSSSGSSGTAAGIASGSAATTSAAVPVQPPPITSAAARFAVDPPPLIIKPRQDIAAPKPAEKRPEQIFTF